MPDNQLAFAMDGANDRSGITGFTRGQCPPKFFAGVLVECDHRMALAAEVLRKEQARAAQQMSKPLEVSRARAAVTTRRAELIRAENLVRNLSDQLKNTMNDPELGLLKNVVLVPADEPSLLSESKEDNF